MNSCPDSPGPPTRAGVGRRWYTRPANAPVGSRRTAGASATSSRLALDARLGDCAGAPASLDNVERSVGACPSRAQYARCRTQWRADYARRPSVRFDVFVGWPGSAVFGWTVAKAPLDSGPVAWQAR